MTLRLSHQLASESNQLPQDPAAKALWAQDLSIPPNFKNMGGPQEESDRGAALNNSYGRVFDAFIDARRNFWATLLRIPYAREAWLQTLKLITSGELLANSYLLHASKHPPGLVSALIEDVSPLVFQLQQEHNAETKLSIRQEIAKRLVRIPLNPERALALAREVSNKSVRFSALENEIAAKGPTRDSRETSEERLREYQNLKAELREPAVQVARDVSALLEARSLYLELKNKLYEAHAFLAIRYSSSLRSSQRIGQSDLLQESNIGLLRAIERYSPDHSVSFPFVARLWMRAQVQVARRASSNFFHVPHPVQPALRKMVDQVPEGDRFLRPHEIGERLGLSPEITISLGRLVLPMMPFGEFDSLSNNSWRPGESRTFSTVHSSNSVTAPLEAQENNQVLLEVVSKLPCEQKRAIHLRFGLDGLGEKTFREIGQVLGTSEATAYRIVNAALKTLQAKLLAKSF